MNSAPGPRVYFPELDGLRFVAFLFVFIHHAFPPSAFPLEAAGATYLARVFCLSGALGVDLFFCLSGFLITRLLLIERERTGRIDVWRFYARRGLRIWPLYFGFIGMCNLGPFSETTSLGDHTLAFLLFAGNWSSCVLGYPQSPAALLWSVSIEEQFYLVWPAIVSKVSQRGILAVAAAMVAVSLAMRTIIAVAEWPHPMTWCNTLARLDPLAVGALIATWPALTKLALSFMTRIALLALGVGMWMVGIAFWPLTSLPSLGSALVGYPLFAVGAGCVLLATLASPGSMAPPVLGHPILRYLGRVSYGLYVFHTLAFMIAHALVNRTIGEYDRGIIVMIGLAVSIILASTSYHLFERVFLRLKARLAVVPTRPGD